jgi:hypothetical protein
MAHVLRDFQVPRERRAPAAEAEELLEGLPRALAAGGRGLGSVAKQLHPYGHQPLRCSQDRPLTSSWRVGLAIVWRQVASPASTAANVATAHAAFVSCAARATLSS